MNVNVSLIHLDINLYVYSCITVSWTYIYSFWLYVLYWFFKNRKCNIAFAIVQFSPFKINLEYLTVEYICLGCLQLVIRLYVVPHIVDRR